MKIPLELPDRAKFGVVDSGGRGAQVVNYLKRDPRVEVVCFPGRQGWGEGVTSCLDIAAGDVDRIESEAISRKLDVVIGGQEIFAANGGTDRLREAGVLVVGPSQKAAELETSKVWCCEFLEQFGIPAPQFEVAGSPEEARKVVYNKFVNERVKSIVVKADGLADGKGVIIANSLKDANAAIQNIMVDGLVAKSFPNAGERVVIQEFLKGREASFTVFTDGKSVCDAPVAVDYKRLEDNDHGPNTGSMGGVTPDFSFTPELGEKVMWRIVYPVIEGMRGEGRPFQGVLYFGLMIVDGEPYVLEINVRLGDVEAQVIIPQLKTPLSELMWAVATGSLGDLKVEWRENLWVVCVVLASREYPGANIRKGFPISGIEKAEKLGVQVLHAGTRKQNGIYLNDGGRVLNVVAATDSLPKSIARAYRGVREIFWEGMRFRGDIGLSVLRGLR